MTQCPICQQSVSDLPRHFFEQEIIGDMDHLRQLYQFAA